MDFMIEKLHVDASEIEDVLKRHDLWYKRCESGEAHYSNACAQRNPPIQLINIERAKGPIGLALLHGSDYDRGNPTHGLFHVTRWNCGRPSSVIWLRMRTPMLASVFWLSKSLALSLGPITVFHRPICVSPRLR